METSAQLVRVIGDLNIAPSQLPHVQVMRLNMRGYSLRAQSSDDRLYLYYLPHGYGLVV